MDLEGLATLSAGLRTFSFPFGFDAEIDGVSTFYTVRCLVKINQYLKNWKSPWQFK